MASLWNLLSGKQKWMIKILTKVKLQVEAIRRKARMDDSLDDGKTMGGGNKKIKTDPSEFRLKCRISYGADHVIENVLPYILPPYYVRCYVDASNDDDENDDVS